MFTGKITNLVHKVTDIVAAFSMGSNATAVLPQVPWTASNDSLPVALLLDVTAADSGSVPFAAPTTYGDEPVVGDIIEGRIVKFYDWYVIVALYGGFIGRLPHNQMSWTKKKLKAEELPRYGDILPVIVQRVSRANPDGKLHIDLGHRELQPNPWDRVGELFQVGDVINGRVSDFLLWGAKVDLDNGFEGIVHNSEVSWTDRKANASDTFKIGDEIPLVVTRIKKNGQSLILSYRQTLRSPWEDVAEKYPVDSNTKAVIEKIVDYGCFMQLDNGCSGLLHRSQMPPSFANEIGSEHNIKILAVDPIAKRISLALAE